MLPGLSHFMLGQNVIFDGKFPLLTFLKISMTSLGLEISHSDSMTFKDLLWMNPESLMDLNQYNSLFHTD